MSSDRNLLYGLLALHNGFVTRDELLDAMNAWLLDKRQALGELLARRGVLTDEDRQALERLADRHERKFGGTRRSLESLTIDPEARRELSRLPLEAEGWSLPPPGTDFPPIASGPPAPYLRYRRLRTHAADGMGEVCVARDEELQREVALKEIRGQFADHPDARGRFVREAELTGNLEHPGIVPVYGLVYEPTGRPMYAMRFIRGETLARALETFHEGGRDLKRLRELLGRFVAVCNAIGYAHSRGVIHRDLKPSNVMLGDFGETLVIDWELARVVKDAEATATAATLPGRGGGAAPTEEGAVFGTLEYMPPEQARGEHDRVGPAADFWALGATLYAILCGQAPYDRRDGTEPARECKFRRPRDVVRSVPPALEAVCLLAMEAEPLRRYPTPTALAEDVGRWLADEPVSAHCEPAVERMSRWGRRHKGAVRAAAALLFLAAVGLAAGLGAVTAEQRRTAAALEQAEENLVLARHAVAECLLIAQNDDLFLQPGMQQAQLRLLATTTPFYERFRAQRPDDASLWREDVVRLGNLAYLTGRLRENAKSEGLFQQALTQQQALIDSRPDELLYQEDHGRTLDNFGGFLTESKRYREAECRFRQAIVVRAELVRRAPDEPAHKHDLAATHNNLANALKLNKLKEEAQKHYALAKTLNQALLRQTRDHGRYLPDLARNHLNLASLLQSQNRPNEALVEFAACLAHLEELSRRSLLTPNITAEVAVTALRERAKLWASNNALGRADADWEAAIRLQPTDHLALPIQIAFILTDAGHADRAESWTDEVCRAMFLPPNGLYELGQCYSLNAAIVGRTPSRPLAKREKDADGLAAKAITQLARAARLGQFGTPAFRAELLRHDGPFAPLHSRPDFRVLVESLAP